MSKELELLKSATLEIKGLRSQNQIMKARLDMFDDCIALLSARVERSGMGMSPDLVWEIEKHIESITEPKNN
jgi:hypothetical protein